MRIDRADSEAELLGPPISNREIVKVVAGDFEVRIAKTAAEIDAAQKIGSHVAMRRTDDIVGSQVHAASNRDRFLAPPYVNSAQNLSLPVELALNAVLELASEL